MTQMITDYPAFLAEAKRAVEELDSYRDSENNLKAEEKRLERMLEAEKKAISDEIAATIRKRVEQINSSYDQEISRGQDRLRKMRARREKAKNQGMKERIAEETQDLCQYNNELAHSMKALFQEKQVPRFCNTKLYYALFYTRGFSEFLILVVTLLICFLALPNLIYLLLPVGKPLYLGGIYFLTVVVFGGLYVWISNRTKLRYLAPLKEGRSIRDQLASNRKKIQVITKSIRRDKNETVYDLEHFDDDIAGIEQELSQVTRQKKEALNTFESVTRSILADEITENNREKMEQIQSDLSRTTKDIQTLAVRIKEQSLYIADHYEGYLEKSYLRPDRLAELSEVIQRGEAKNLTDAIALLKNR